MHARNALAAALLLAVAFAGAAPAAQGFSAARQQADLRYLESKLLQHPMLQLDPGKRKIFQRYAAKLVATAAQPLPNWRFLLLADRMANWFHDPHTAVAIQLPYAPLSYIPVAFVWSGRKLLAVHMPGTPKQVATGDRVLAISGITPRMLLRRLRRFFSGNSYWLRSSGFTNGLPTGTLLHWLGAVSGGKVVLTLEHPSGARYTLALTLRTMTTGVIARWNRYGEALSRRLNLPNGLRWTQGAAWMYAVTPRYGYFLLAQCDDTPAYERAVDAFFRKVRSEGAPNVVLDLRFNPGGSSAVMNAWLGHLPARYAEADGIGVDVLPPVFRGRLYVLQSYNTFSSATLLVEALTGPGLGVRVGQPMGEATGGWGNIRGYELPYSQLYFQVSTSFISPIKGPLRPTLKPQIPIVLTAADLREGIDPVAQWLRTLPGTPPAAAQ